MSQILSLSTIFSALILTDNVLTLKTISTYFSAFTKNEKTFLLVHLTNFFVCNETPTQFSSSLLALYPYYPMTSSFSLRDSSLSSSVTLNVLKFVKYRRWKIESWVLILVTNIQIIDSI